MLLPLPANTPPHVLQSNPGLSLSVRDGRKKKAKKSQTTATPSQRFAETSIDRFLRHRRPLRFSSHRRNPILPPASPSIPSDSTPSALRTFESPGGLQRGAIRGNALGASLLPKRRSTSLVILFAPCSCTGAPVRENGARNYQVRHPTPHPRRRRGKPSSARPGPRATTVCELVRAARHRASGVFVAGVFPVPLPRPPARPPPAPAPPLRSSPRNLRALLGG